MSPLTPRSLLPATVAFFCALGLTPVLRKVALAAGLVDASDGNRKLHERPVPPIGGLALVLSAGLAAMGFIVLSRATSVSATPQLTRILVGALAMHLLGIVDDLRPMR